MFSWGPLWHGGRCVFLAGCLSLSILFFFGCLLGFLFVCVCRNFTENGLCWCITDGRRALPYSLRYYVYSLLIPIQGVSALLISCRVYTLHVYGAVLYKSIKGRSFFALSLAPPFLSIFHPHPSYFPLYNRHQRSESDVFPSREFGPPPSLPFCLAIRFGRPCT